MKMLLINGQNIRKNIILSEVSNGVTYYLKYKDIVVLAFNTISKSVIVYNQELLPIQIQNKINSYDMIKVFCSGRLLMMNREYCKEILTACGIDDQSDVNICVISRALSFRDNYWICSAESNEIWDNINLYHNKFSLSISKVALTGDMEDITIEDSIGDNLYTGELTNKGTRAKCFIRNNNNIYLIKSETQDEISSEIISSYIAIGFNLNCSKYQYIKYLNKNCSMCQITTSEIDEMIPCRDIMEYYEETATSFKNNTYKTFFRVDTLGFIKMQLFDYVTLNTDRNRDNYGILRRNGQMLSLYPIFDHDSCFKGKSTNGIYFPAGLTFGKTLEMIKSEYNKYYKLLYPQFVFLNKYLSSKDFKSMFLTYKSKDVYDSMMNRVNDLI